jgi:hypothetical protein
VTAFADLRAVLVADLAAVFPPTVALHPSWPDRVDPPCAFVTPPSTADWVVRGPTFAEHTVALDLVVLVDHAAAGPALEALEELVALALRNTADWALSSVDPPAPLAVSESGAEYLAAVIHLSKPTSI